MGIAMVYIGVIGILLDTVLKHNLPDETILLRKFMTSTILVVTLAMF